MGRHRVGAEMSCYQYVLCLGDSITAGARASAGWPEFLEGRLAGLVGLTFLCLNRAVNSRTALDVLRSVDADLVIPKLDAGAGGPPYIVVLCAGANDAKVGTKTSVYAELYAAIIRHVLAPDPTRRVLCLEIPPFQPATGHVPFSSASAELVAVLNRAAQFVTSGWVRDSAVTWLAPNWSPEWFADAVHLNDSGQQAVAKAVAEAILAL